MADRLRALILVVALAACSRPAPRETVRFNFSHRPFSSDPIELDHRANLMAMAPVYACLVSDFKGGGYQGVLAESWEASADFRDWTFRIRGGMRFETGEEIGARDIAASWRRLALVMAARRTQGSFIQDLEGYGAFAASRGGLSGLAHDADSLRLRFARPMPGLLAALSEPMYAVVSPSCYDASTGAWLCSRRAVASGPYRVERWDEDGLELALREEFPDAFLHSRPIRRFAIRTDWKPEQTDLAAGTSKRPPPSPAFVFSGRMESGITFARCASWARGAGPCRDPAARRRLREAFYAALGEKGLRPVRSFFPLMIPGVRELPASPGPGGLGARGALLRVDQVKGGSAFAAACNAAMEEAVARAGGRFEAVSLSAEEWNEELEPDLPRRRADVTYGVTEITPDQSVSSVRYMFRSKEGIRLPDPTGAIERELARKDLDLQRINELMWDDAVIWPIEHHAWGIWAKSDFDLSQLNMVLPYAPLQWIGWRD